MRMGNLVIGSTMAVILMAGQAFAFSCPTLVKAANESITKAESNAGKITEEREKGRAMAMITEAKELVKQAEADHKEAGAKKDAELHYRAEAKAKAAKVLVDLVK
jgi:hypothetical protein